ncbi:MAG: hypothetical protein HOC77_11055 [Chloroflexi bacterium]|jgi:hypothetical protein|nr:hypothetical protein [Chloroflexota bacterium]MBT4073210.1 hypothetical protein [Chloroflexota bacterium]MBT4515614.1 hypothetical protein [Chloroflexota bacterium]MBT6680892.1 hypothetical protein [Chloroflexota bacterium]
MFRTIGHTFELIKVSWSVLMKDKELIFFPIMGGIGVLILLGVFFAIASATGTIDHFEEPTKFNAATGLEENQVVPLDLILAGATFFAAYFIVIFFNAALVSAAQERLRGGDPNISSGLSHASKHIHTIFLWSVIAAVVALILMYLRSRSRGNMMGSIGTSLLSSGWAMITFFVIPILVTEGVGPITAMKRSTGLFTATWGRQLTSNFGFGIIYIGVMLVVGLITAIFSAITPIIGIPIGVVVFAIGIGGVQAMEGIFKAALYDYARGEKPLIFQESDLRMAYAPNPAAAGA